MFHPIVVGSHESRGGVVLGRDVYAGSGVDEHFQQLQMSFLGAEEDGRDSAAVVRPRVDHRFQDISSLRFPQKHFEDLFGAGLRGEKQRRQSVFVGGVDVDRRRLEENLHDAIETVVCREMQGSPSTEVGLS